MRRGAHSRASGARPSAWRGSSARASLLDGLEPREVGLALGPCKDPPLVVPPVLALHRGSRRASDVMDPESALERRAADRRHVEDRAVRLAVRLGVQHEPRREEGGRGGGRLPATRRRLLAAPHHAASSRRASEPREPLLAQRWSSTSPTPPTMFLCIISIRTGSAGLRGTLVAHGTAWPRLLDFGATKKKILR